MAALLPHHCPASGRQRVDSPGSEADRCPSGMPADHRWRKAEGGSLTYPEVHHQAAAVVAVETEAGVREEEAVGKRCSQQPCCPFVSWTKAEAVGGR